MKRMMMIYSALAALIWMTAIGYATAPAPVTIPGRTEDMTELLLPRYQYELTSVQQVDGRQGIAWEDGQYWVSGSTSLSRYDGDWSLIALNESPFDDLGEGINHIGDIDVYDGELYAGVEYFADGSARDIRIAVYDAGTLKLKRCYDFDPSSGQTEVSGIAVDPDHRIVWMCSWADGETGRYLYKYALDDGSYLGKVHLQSPPQWIQGVAYYDGFLYLTADDGTADLGEPDHLYRGKADPEATRMTVTLERTFDDVTMQGEIEGLSFDRENGCLLISYNRGAQVVLGIPMGFYDGYDGEIHEVFVFSAQERE
ncbi:MAG: PQQ-like beta-propeller repeat protein [Clostridia bacterium]|nr:PQQ-like beta-propeller repeat protein [Clostridia bacterium]